MGYPKEYDLVIMFIDVSRAHLHSPQLREFYCDPPVEDLECPAECCWQLFKIAYEQKDAGKGFGLNCDNVAVGKLGARQGTFVQVLT